MELLLQTTRTQNHARRMGTIRRHGRRLRPRGPVSRPVKCVNPVAGQGGLGHINEQPLVYWVNKFWSHHYVPLEPLRPYISSDRNIYPWLRQNIVMFASYNTFVRSVNLQKVARPLSDFNLRYPI